jgi:uncharacterized DUF497 family protein
MAFRQKRSKRFFCIPVMILPDEGHSRTESRLKAIGKTEAGRYVFLVFAIRKREGRRYIRPISAPVYAQEGG